MNSDYRVSTAANLTRFARDVLTRVGVTAADAEIVADVLVAADLRGIEAHGIACLASTYVNRIRTGRLAPAAIATVARETPTTLVFDAGNGLGGPAAKRAMLGVIEKAKRSGAAFGAVRNSNHFGIAGYYAMLALDHDMIGIASTTSQRNAPPTFGSDTALGANPWAYAVPAANEPPFVLDFATTAVPRDAGRGRAQPLGGAGMEGGGHKGYGLSLLADVMCAVLAGGAFGDVVPHTDHDAEAGKTSHFFGAFRIDGFRDVAGFKADMDRELRAFKNSQKAPGTDRLYVAGEIEQEKAAARARDGVPVGITAWAELERLASEFELPFGLAR